MEPSTCSIGRENASHSGSKDFLIVFVWWRVAPFFDITRNGSTEQLDTTSPHIRLLLPSWQMDWHLPDRPNLSFLSRFRPTILNLSLFSTCTSLHTSFNYNSRGWNGGKECRVAQRIQLLFLPYRHPRKSALLTCFSSLKPMRGWAVSLQLLAFPLLETAQHNHFMCKVVLSNLLLPI